MTGKRAPPKRATPCSAEPDERSGLVDSTWVHVFEEDGPEGEVYRPESESIPRSRRTRQRLRLFPDGTARILCPAPDDRHHAVAAHWNEHAGEITVTPDSAAAGVKPLRARLEGPTRLVVRR